ncbi:hypothetical protein EBR78_08895 [bacterium]|nr:hypothetical protein [bacterium]
MSKMAELDIEIQEMLLEGNEPAVIAKVLNVPMEWVEATMASMEPEAGVESFDDFDVLDDVHALARLEWCWSSDDSDEDDAPHEADF